MIFLIATAAVCMGGIVAYLAYEKGRAPLIWALYGTVAAPIALVHILLARARADDSRGATRAQSVNDRDPILARAEHAGGERIASYASLLANRPPARLKAAPEPDHMTSTETEPTHNMFADKSFNGRTTRSPAERAEPSFGQTAAPAHATGQRGGEFKLNASDRIGASFTAPSSAQGAEDRARAPLSIDPAAQRGQDKSIAGKLFAAGAIAVAVAAGVFVFGPTLARLVPPELAFWSKPQVQEVKNTSAPSAPGLSPSTPGVAPSSELPGGTGGSNEARDVGTAKFGGPIKSDPKAPVYQSSGAAPVDLAAATRGMKPVDVPNESVGEPKPEAKSEPKSAPKAAAPKAEPKPAPPPAAAKADAPKAVAKADATKPAPKPAAAPKAAPQEDFLSMVNKAIGTKSAAPASPAPQSAAVGAGEAVGQVSEANDLVQSVQMKLRERGFDPGAVDGRTGPQTVQAVREYQQSVGLPADGLIDVALMERLGVVGKRLQFPSGR